MTQKSIINHTQDKISAHNEHMAKQIFGKAMTLRMPATRTDPECATTMYETRLEDAETWLRENPESLMDVDVDALVAIWKNHHGDKLNLGEVFDRYMEGLIEEQAKESVDVELNL